MSSQRTPIQQMSAPGFADGDLPGWDSINGLFVPKSAVLGLTSDDLTVSINPNGDGTLDLSVTGGGGGGGTGNDRRWNVGAGETSIDEFNDGILAAAWTRVDGTGAAAGNIAWTEGADTLSSRRIAANTLNAINALVRPIGTAPATGDAWITCMTLFGKPSTQHIIGGIIISDGTTHGSGKQIAAEIVSNSTGGVPQQSYAVSWSNWTTAGTVGTTTNIVPLGTPVFVRLVYKGSSQWRADTSPNGIEWITGASLVTQSSFTPSHVGLYSRDGGSGTPAIGSYEFLRRASGVS